MNYPLVSLKSCLLNPVQLIQHPLVTHLLPLDHSVPHSFFLFSFPFILYNYFRISFFLPAAHRVLRLPAGFLAHFVRGFPFFKLLKNPKQPLLPRCTVVVGARRQFPDPFIRVSIPG